jgi:hypothetical protein
MIILPRQARDKCRESTQKTRCAFCRRTETLWFGGSRLLLPHSPAAPRWQLESSGEVRTWSAGAAQPQPQQGSSRDGPGGGMGAGGGGAPWPQPWPQMPQMPEMPQMAEMPQMPPPGGMPTPTPMMPPPAGTTAWAPPAPAAVPAGLQLPVGTTAVSAAEVAALTSRLTQLQSLSSSGSSSSGGVDVERLIDAIADAMRAVHSLRAVLDLSIGLPDAGEKAHLNSFLLTLSLCL